MGAIMDDKDTGSIKGGQDGRRKEKREGAPRTKRRRATVGGAQAMKQRRDGYRGRSRGMKEDGTGATYCVNFHVGEFASASTMIPSLVRKGCR